MTAVLKERVLVVDDSPQNRMVACGHLEAEGYEALTAASGEAALELLATERVDLVILDVLMPGLGGFETCRRIRQTPVIADVPVLFLTALGDREATAPALDAGGDDLLPKPFHHAELVMRVRALIRQRRTNSELKEALRAVAEQNETLRRIEHDKRKISQLILHDLKGPVLAVIANAELIKKHATGDVAEIIGDVLTAAQHLDRTARDLLDLSSAEEGALTPQPESFSLTELIAEVASAMRGLARFTEITFELDVADARIVADRELIRRLVQNLVHNAVKHAPPRTAIRIEAGVDSDGLLLRVLDSGPGVAPDAVARIFDRFGRLSGGPGRTSGHGLGLVFCRLAAEAHGGRIWVEPRDGSGAAFCVRIPQPSA